MNAYKTFKRWRVIRRYDATYKLPNGVVGQAGNERLSFCTVMRDTFLVLL